MLRQQFMNAVATSGGPVFLSTALPFK